MIKTLSKSLNKTDAVKNKTQLMFSASILGILQRNPLKWFEEDYSDVEVHKIDDLINLRDKARKSKNFELADKLRNQLSSMGIEIEDNPEGTTWRKK